MHESVSSNTAAEDELQLLSCKRSWILMRGMSLPWAVHWVQHVQTQTEHVFQSPINANDHLRFSCIAVFTYSLKGLIHSSFCKYFYANVSISLTFMGFILAVAERMHTGNSGSVSLLSRTSDVQMDIALQPWSKQLVLQSYTRSFL